jgi:hypothetical protein
MDMVTMIIVEQMYYSQAQKLVRTMSAIYSNYPTDQVVGDMVGDSLRSLIASAQDVTILVLESVCFFVVMSLHSCNLSAFLNPCYT